MKLIDAQSLTTSSISVDICIVGAGPAGITLARELAGTEFKVLVIESGGREKRRDTEMLNNAEYEGTPYQNARHTRRRQIGGTANRWSVEMGPNTIGVRYCPLDPIDFEQRDALPHSGWAIQYDEIKPYYERAQAVCHLGPFAYNADAWQTPTMQPLVLGDALTSGMYQFGERAVFTEGHERATQAPDENITLLYNATVEQVDTDASGQRVTGVHVMTYNGVRLNIYAERVVLAMGGIETVRQLLLSSSSSHPAGLGNDTDQLGRYYMDHPQAHLGSITPKNREIFEQAALYDLHWNPKGGYSTLGMLKFSEAAQKRDNLHSYAFILYARRATHLTATYQAYKAYEEGLNYRYIPPNPTGNLLEMAKHPATMLKIANWKLTRQNHYLTLGQGGWSQVANGARIFDMFEVITLIEQPPRPENRITLGEGRDAYGQRQARIHWHWLPEDTRQVQRSREVFAGTVEQTGIGEVKFPDAPYHVAGSHHHMGGARMSADACEGVVDENCEVHGVDGLFVASSATFATGGFSNPTLTIVALAIRLADHLKQWEKAHEKMVVTLLMLLISVVRLLQTQPHLLRLFVRRV